MWAQTKSKVYNYICICIYLFIYIFLYLHFSNLFQLPVNGTQCQNKVEGVALIGAWEMGLCYSKWVLGGVWRTLPWTESGELQPIGIPESCVKNKTRISKSDSLRGTWFEDQGDHYSFEGWHGQTSSIPEAFRPPTRHEWPWQAPTMFVWGWILGWADHFLGTLPKTVSATSSFQGWEMPAYVFAHTYSCWWRAMCEEGTNPCDQLAKYVGERNTSFPWTPPRTPARAELHGKNLFNALLGGHNVLASLSQKTKTRPPVDQVVGCHDRWFHPSVWRRYYSLHRWYRYYSLSGASGIQRWLAHVGKIWQLDAAFWQKRQAHCRFCHLPSVQGWIGRCPLRRVWDQLHMVWLLLEGKAVV